LGAGKQLDLGVSVGQFYWYKLLVGTQSWSSAFLACLLWMCLAVSGSGLFAGFLLPIEFFLLLALFGNGFSLEAHAYCIKPVQLVFITWKQSITMSAFGTCVTKEFP
ncbi:MAG: hypothetical protein MSA38_04565, partial [Bacteroidales bacterium]|nr:hypothetical protein [Bacteroidales bacterium]